MMSLKGTPYYGMALDAGAAKGDEAEQMAQMIQADDWESQFPCSCGHSPDRHFQAPIEGECHACADCHGDAGAMLRFGTALVEAAHKDEA